MTLFCFKSLGEYCNPQHRVTSIATAFGPPNFQMEITPCYPPLQIVNSVPLSLYPLSRPFSILSLLPLHHPFFLFWSILCPPKIKTTSFITFCFTPWLFFLIMHSACKNHILMLDACQVLLAIVGVYSILLTLSCRSGCMEDVSGSRNNGYIAGPDLENSCKGRSLRPFFSSNLFSLSAPFLNPLSSPFPHFP